MPFLNVDEFTATVAEWMEKEGRSRQFLARKCNVDERTVGNWFTRKERGIPERQKPRIMELMKADGEVKQNIVIKTSPDRFERIDAKAKEKNLTLYEYINLLIDKDVDGI